jgi:hypothetical protein
MKELLKELLESLNNDIYYLDENGDKIDPLDAAKSGLMVRPVDSRIEAKKQLKQKGIDMDDQELVKIMQVFAYYKKFGLHLMICRKAVVLKNPYEIRLKIRGM